MNVLRCSPGFTQTAYHYLSQCMKLSLSDQRCRCSTASSLAEAEFSVGNAIRKAWTCVERGLPTNKHGYFA